MNLPAINLFEVVKKYLQKSVFAHSGEGSDPSINMPTVVLNLPKESRPRFACMTYSSGVTTNPYIAADGTKYGVQNTTFLYGSFGTVVDGLELNGSTGSGVRTVNEPGFSSASVEIFTLDPTKVKEVSMPCRVIVHRFPSDGSQQTDIYEFTYKVVFNLVEDTGPVADTEIDIPTSIIGQVQNSYIGATNLIGGTVYATGVDAPNLFAFTNAPQLRRGGMASGLWRTGTNSRVVQYLSIGVAKNENISSSDSDIYNDTANNYAGIVICGRDNSVSLGVHRSDGTTKTNAPIYIVDKAGTAAQVYILGRDVEWVTTTIDGVQRKVLAAKA